MTSNARQASWAIDWKERSRHRLRATLAREAPRDRTIATVEARGNGGQYIFVAPELDLVVVITSGNFRTGLTRQPEEIMRRYVLPAALGLPTAED